MIIFNFISIAFAFQAYIKHHRKDVFISDGRIGSVYTNTLRPCGYAGASMYEILPFSSTEFAIIDVNTGKAVNLTCGDKLNLFLFTGYESQLFSLHMVEHNLFSITHHGRCIEASAFGTEYEYVACDGSDNQLFSFVFVDEASQAEAVTYLTNLYDYYGLELHPIDYHSKCSLCRKPCPRCSKSLRGWLGYPDAILGSYSKICPSCLKACNSCLATPFIGSHGCPGGCGCGAGCLNKHLTGHYGNHALFEYLRRNYLLYGGKRGTCHKHPRILNPRYHF